MTETANQKGFFPTEVIFALTDACNLHCAHCFVPRKARHLKIQDATDFIEECAKNIAPDGLPFINKVGFSGGEPFLNLNFLCKVTETSVKSGMIFDRIMTNAVWWKDKNELFSALQKIYDCGFDGKIGISFDNFHGQSAEKIADFINTAAKIWQNPEIIEIQSVIDTRLPLKEDSEHLHRLANILNADFYEETKKDGIGEMAIENDNVFVRIFRFLPSLQSENPAAWKSKKWFKEDFCKGPGNIFYVHPDGNIAPCCGFSNENSELFIGTIKTPFAQLLENSKNNKMVKICFEQGLSSLIPQAEKQLKESGIFSGHEIPRTENICTFCDYAAKNLCN